MENEKMKKDINSVLREYFEKQKASRIADQIYEIVKDGYNKWSITQKAYIRGILLEYLTVKGANQIIEKLEKIF